MNEQLPLLPYPQLDSLPAFTEPGYTADQMRDYARAALAVNEKRATDIANALALPGCERLREWAEIGPVQRAAVEEFAYALAANVPAGYKLVPIEPTKEMILAGNAAAHAGGSDLWQLTREVMNAWPAMLAAAPEAKP